MLYNSCGHGADIRSVVSLGSTCTLLRSVADEEAIWRPVVKRHFKAAAALYQSPNRRKDVNATEKDEYMEHRWAFGRNKVYFYMEFKKNICRKMLMLLLSCFTSLVGSPSVLIFGFDIFLMVYIKSEFPSIWMIFFNN
jgi:hypothetical protein